MKHTLTPWRWWTSNSFRRLTGADGKDGGVLHAAIVGGNFATIVVSEADAEFMETACNAHDDLIAALHAFMSTDKSFLTVPDKTLSAIAADGNKLAGVVKQARAALILAKAAMPVMDEVTLKK